MSNFQIFYYGSISKQMNESYKQEFLFKMSQGLIFYVLACMKEDQAVLKHETNILKPGKFLPMCNCN